MHEFLDSVNIMHCIYIYIYCVGADSPGEFIFMFMFTQRKSSAGASHPEEFGP